MKNFPLLPSLGGDVAKEVAIYSVINGLNQVCVCSTLNTNKTTWNQGDVTGDYIKRSGANFIAVKSGKFIFKNRISEGIEKYCEAGEIIGTTNNNYADIWVCIAL